MPGDDTQGDDRDSANSSAVVSSWLNNPSFSGNLSALFSQLARDVPVTSEVHEIGNTSRPKASDFFDSDTDDEIEDDEEFHAPKLPENIQHSAESTYRSAEEHRNDSVPDSDYLWVEKSELESEHTKKRKRNKEDKRSRKRRKHEHSSSAFAKKSTKKKLKEKEKLLKLEEKVLKEYGSIARSSSYQWGTIKKDQSGNYISVKENPLKSDNEFYYWDSKADKDLLMYERIHSASVPSYYHAPRRSLGLGATETLRYG